VGGGVLTNTQQEAEDLVCGPSLIAFRTNETAQGADLNLDGDTSDDCQRTRASPSRSAGRSATRTRRRRRRIDGHGDSRCRAGDVIPGFAPDDPDFFLGDPHPTFCRLRREDPVHWYERAACWCLTKHADVEHVLRSPQLFTSTQGVMLGVDPDNRPEGVPPSILEMDPPEHNRHRKLVMQAFTPRAVAALEPRIRGIARESLDAVPLGEPVDFVEAVSIPLPMYVIAEMLGVPRADWPAFRRWSDATIRAAGGMRDDDTDGAMGEMFAYFAEQLADRRRVPREDLVSTLAHAQADGDRLTDPEILIFCVTLLVGGNETTRNLISGGTLGLMHHPEQRRVLRADGRLLPNAIEEMLRWWTPVASSTRHATRPTTLRGRTIGEGDCVLLLYPAANRDEEVWGDDADRFDVMREHAGRRHVAFGFGEHLCLGASLARLEARVLFEELFTRLPDFEPAGPAVRLRSRMINGIERLPVLFRTGTR
jgi:cytochrome P450